MTKEKYVRKAKLTDPAILAKKMRVADVKEIWASHRAKPLDALMYAFTVRTSYWYVWSSTLSVSLW